MAAPPQLSQQPLPDDGMSVDQILVWLTGAILALVPVLLVAIVVVSRFYETALTRLATIRLDSPSSSASPQPLGRPPQLSPLPATAAAPEPAWAAPAAPGDKPKQP